MPKKCCISNCRIQQDDPEGRNVSYFKLPADESCRKRWIDSIKSHVNIEIKKYSYVCSLHFQESCFHNNGSTSSRKLKKDSCPTIFSDFRRSNQKDITTTMQSSINLQNTVVTSLDTDINNGNINIPKECKKLNDCFTNIETRVSSGNCDVKDPSNMLNLPLHSNVVIPRSKSLEINSTTDETFYEDKCNNSETITSGSVSIDPSPTEIELRGLSSVEHSSDECETDVQTSEIQKHHDYCKKTDSFNINIFKKSLANIDIESLSFTPENLPKIKMLMMKGKSEVKRLRQKIKMKRFQFYRCRSRISNLKSLLSHIKQQQCISDKACEILKVSD